MSYKIYGENLIKYPYLNSTRTTNGITFTDNGDRSITVNGTTTAQASFYVSHTGKNQGEILLEAGSYVISGGAGAALCQAAYSYDDWATSLWSGASTGGDMPLDLTSRARVRIIVFVKNGNTVSNAVVTPRIAKITTLPDKYQLVLVRNRVVAFGDACFYAMGGTVICTKTGRKFENATVAETETPPPCDLGQVGYEFIGGEFIPCEPYGKIDEGYLFTACNDCKTPKQTSIPTAAVKELVNTYATIDVTYPSGSVCTCSKAPITLTADGKAGFESFNVPSAGTWTIKITKGVDTAEKTVTISERWQYAKLSMSFFSATITVSYPEGSTCTCSDGVTTLTAPNTSGSCIFTLPNAGSWEIEATDGTDTDSATVEITANGQSESVVLVFPLYVYDKGTINTADFSNLTAYAYKPSTSSATAEKPTVTKNTASITLKFTDAEYSRGGSYFTDKAINLSKYSNIHIKVTSAKTTNSNGYIRFGSTKTKANSYEVSSAQTICNGNSTVSEKTFDLSVADFSDDHYLFINMYGGGAKTLEFTEWWLD